MPKHHSSTPALSIVSNNATVFTRQRNNPLLTRMPHPAQATAGGRNGRQVAAHQRAVKRGVCVAPAERRPLGRLHDQGNRQGQLLLCAAHDAAAGGTARRQHVQVHSPCNLPVSYNVSNIVMDPTMGTETLPCRESHTKKCVFLASSPQDLTIPGYTASSFFHKNIRCKAISVTYCSIYMQGITPDGSWRDVLGQQQRRLLNDSTQQTTS